MGYSLTAGYHTLVSGLEDVFFRRRIASARVEPPPVFIIGHWRTGTTLMHILLGLDNRFRAPATHECLNPSHIFLRARIERWIMRRSIPERRPADEMPLSNDSPQEDEFALALLGAASPYLKLAYPNDPRPFPDSWRLEDLPPGELDRWQQTFRRFLTRLLARRGGWLLLKSPPHTCRIKALSEMFPGSRFIYMVRSPYDVIPSTICLWKALYGSQALQWPDFSGLEEDVFRTFGLFHELAESAGPSVPDGRFVRIRFEDLTADPLPCLKEVYARLGLGRFEDAAPLITSYLARHPQIGGRTWNPDPALRRRITERGRSYMEVHGYPFEP